MNTIFDELKQYTTSKIDLSDCYSNELYNNKQCLVVLEKMNNVIFVGCYNINYVAKKFENILKNSFVKICAYALESTFDKKIFISVFVNLTKYNNYDELNDNDKKIILDVSREMMMYQKYNSRNETNYRLEHVAKFYKSVNIDLFEEPSYRVYFYI